jgi:hypothetical protein
MISPAASWIAGIGYIIRQANDAPLNTSSRNRDQYVAAVRHSRDLSLPEPPKEHYRFDG